MKRIFTAVLLTLSLFALAACGGAKQPAPAAEQPKAETKAPAGPKTFKSDLGEIKLEKTPTKVVAINLQAIDSLVALGVKPVGYAEPGGEPAPYLGNALDGIPKVGTHSKPSLEAIMALQPDLIIVDSLQQKDQVSELQKIAPVVGIRAMSYQESIDGLKLLGDILDKRAAADKFAADLDAKIKEYTGKAKGQKGPKVVSMYGTTDRAWAWMDKSFIGSLLTALGAQHPYKGDADKTYPDTVLLSIEKIAELNPEVFFFMSTPGKELSKGWEKNPAFAATDAVKNKRVYEVDRQAWSRSRGPVAATKVLEQAFPLLYPNAK